jgi:archaellum component FlaC
MSQSAFDTTPVTEWVGHPTQWLFEDFLFPQFTGSSAVAFVLTTVIFAVCLGFAARYAVKTLRIRRRLKPLLGYLHEKIHLSDDENDTLARASFREHYQDVREKFEHIDFLNHGWTEFSETLVIQEDDHAPISNTVRPSVYLNFHTADEAGKWGFKFLQGLPNLFVGFGLLFTFLGLAAALFAASSGLNGNIEEAQKALQSLLHAATFKFLTSIAGLASSIFLTILCKHWHKQIQRDFDRLCRYLEKGLLFISLEKLNSDQIVELRRQTEQLQRFNQDMAISIGNEINTFMGSKLPYILQKTFEPMQQALEKLSAFQVEQQWRCFEPMLKELEKLGNGGRDAIKEIAGDDIKSVVSTINDVANDLKTVMQSVKTSSQGASDGLSAIVGDLALTLKNFDQQTQHQQRTFAEHASGIIESSANALSERFAGAASQLESVVHSFGDGFNQKMGHATNTMATHLQTAAQDMQNQLHAATTHFASGFAESAKPFAAQMGEFVATLKNFDQQARNQQQAFESIATKIRESADVVSHTLHKLDAAATPMSLTAQQFERTAFSLQAVSETMRQSQQSITTMITGLQENNARVTAVWQDYQARFENIDASLSKTFQHLVDASNSQLERIASFTNKLDESFARASNSLGSAIEGLEDVLEDMAALKQAA